MGWVFSNKIIPIISRSLYNHYLSLLVKAWVAPCTISFIFTVKFLICIHANTKHLELSKPWKSSLVIPSTSQTKLDWWLSLLLKHEEASLYVIQTFENSCLLLRLSGERYILRGCLFMFLLCFEKIYGNLKKLNMFEIKGRWKKLYIIMKERFGYFEMKSELPPRRTPASKF